jgi:hypothetical protein
MNHRYPGDTGLKASEDCPGAVGRSLAGEQLAHLSRVSALKPPYPRDFIAQARGDC